MAWGRPNAFSAAFKDYWYCTEPGCHYKTTRSPETVDRHKARVHKPSAPEVKGES